MVAGGRPSLRGQEAAGGPFPWKSAGTALLGVLPHLAMSLAVFRSVFAATMAFLGFGAIGLILWFGGREVIEGRLTLPMISGFVIYGVTIAANLGGLAGFYTSLRESLGSIRRVFELIEQARAAFWRS